MKTALVAGTGRLPKILADRGDFVRIAALEGFVPEDVPVDATFRVENLGTFIADLGARGIERICFAGAIRRPELDLARIDAATMPLVPRLAQAARTGDDAALRTVLAFFEEAGIAAIGAAEIAPELLPPPGILAGEMSETTATDAERAAGLVAAMGPLDVGQACIVAHGQVLAMEGLPGTDWMIASIAAARGGGDAGLACDLPPGGLLYKAPKPGQDRRVDLPAIGPETVRRVAAAGLEGIVVEAGGVMLLDREEAVELARAQGLLLWVRPA